MLFFGQTLSKIERIMRMRFSDLTDLGESVLQVKKGGSPRMEGYKFSRAVVSTTKVEFDMTSDTLTYVTPISEVLALLNLTVVFPSQSFGQGPGSTCQSGRVLTVTEGQRRSCQLMSGLLSKRHTQK